MRTLSVALTVTLLLSALPCVAFAIAQRNVRRLGSEAPRPPARLWQIALALGVQAVVTFGGAYIGARVSDASSIAIRVLAAMFGVLVAFTFLQFFTALARGLTGVRRMRDGGTPAP